MYLGDFVKGALIPLPWNTSGGDGASITRSTNGTFRVYKNGNAGAPITAGITDTKDFNAKTGMHVVAIDSANAAYTAGDEYEVSFDGGVIDGKTANAFSHTFSIQRPTSLKPVVGVAQGGASGNVQLPAAASSVDDSYEGAFVVITGGTGAGQARWRGTTYVGATRAFSVDPAFTTAPDNTSVVEVHLVPTPRTTTPLPVTVTAMAADSLTAAAMHASASAEILAALAVADNAMLLAIAQEVAYTMSGGRGNAWEIQGSLGSEQLVFFDTDGVTELARVAVERLGAALNGIRKTGG